MVDRRGRLVLAGDLVPALSLPDARAVLLRPALVGSLLVVGAALLALRWRRSLPSFAVGSCWFVVTLLPVIGLVQVGTQAFADRYTYLPSIGLACLVAFALEKLCSSHPGTKAAIVACSLLSLGVLALGTFRQLSMWRDSETLFRETLARTERNYLPHLKLGELARERGNLEEAAAELSSALAVHRLCADALRGLAQVELERGNLERAERFNERLLALNPENLDGLLNKAALQLARGDVAGARQSFEALLAIDPANVSAHFNLGIAAQSENDLPRAEAHYRSALEVDPDDGGSLNNLGQVLLARGQTSEAASVFERLTTVEPHDAGAQWNLGIALNALGRSRDAERAFQRAHELDPSYPRAAARAGKD